MIKDDIINPSNAVLYLRLALHSISIRIPSPNSAPPNIVLTNLCFLKHMKSKKNKRQSSEI